MKRISIFFITTLLIACGGYHGVLGSSRGYSASEITVQSDINVSGLRIRYSTREQKAAKDLSCPSGRVSMIELNGPIGPDSSEIIDRILSKAQPCNGLAAWVYLNSNGGRLSDGYKLANIFKKYSVFTIVMDGQTCASACAIAYLGGEIRTVMGDGKLVFHAPYVKNPITGDAQCKTRTDSEELRNFYISLIGRKDGAYLFERTMDSCSTTGGWVINKDAAKMFGIANIVK